MENLLSNPDFMGRLAAFVVDVVQALPTELGDAPLDEKKAAVIKATAALIDTADLALPLVTEAQSEFIKTKAVPLAVDEVFAALGGLR